MARILLLSVDRALAQTIDNAIGDRASVELVQAIEPEHLDGLGLIVIDRAAIPPERSMATAIGTVVDTARGWPVVLAADHCDGDEILRAVRAGANDVIARTADGAEIADVFTRLLNIALVEQGKAGQLTLVLGVDLDATAIFATDLALARARERASVLLVDCTLPTSTCEAYLDLDVGYGLASAIADIDRLDASLLSSALARHEPSGLMLLTFDGGTGAEPVGIVPNDIAALVRLLRACCSDVIFCAGSLRHPGLLRELGSIADRVELVCSQSIRELEATRRMLERITPDTPTMERMRLLIWDHLPGVLLDGRRMAAALEVGSVLGIPTDRTRMRNALNAGHPLALEADGGPYLQAVRRAGGVAHRTARAPQGGAGKLRNTILRVVGRRP